MSSFKSWGPVFAGVSIIGSSFILGAFYTHWIVDHETIWTTSVLPSSITNSLRYYQVIFSAPAWYPATLFTVAIVSLLAVFIKLITSGTSGMLFDGASVMLLASALAVYTTNVHAALAYLPLDKVPSFVPSFLAPPVPIVEGSTKEALQSLAASHMIIAVSLTGVLALQAAQSYSDKPTELVEVVRGPPIAGLPESPRLQQGENETETETETETEKEGGSSRGKGKGGNGVRRR